MANCLFYSWEGGGHVFVFFSAGKGCHLFFSFGVDGHPSIVLFGRGLLVLFYFGWLAIYYFSILGGMGTYLFLYLGGDGQLSVLGHRTQMSAGQDTDVF